jgi:hypothetical protein
MYLGNVTKCEQRMDAHLKAVETKLVTDQQSTSELPPAQSTGHDSTCETIFTGWPGSI